MSVVRSVKDVPIRMTRERWQHIIENHNDLADHYDTVLSTIEHPDLVISG